MAVTINELSCQEPDALAQQCVEAQPQLPLDPWHGVANRFANPLGLRAGRGWLLLSRANLNALDWQSEYYELVFSSSPVGMAGTSVTVSAVRLVGTPIALTPGVRGDTMTTFLVEIADERVDSVGWANRRYNWRIFPDCPYDWRSCNPGTSTTDPPWTWDLLLEDLWDQVGNLGDWPGLPRSIAGTPQQIDATATRAACIIEDLLLLNNMAVCYDVTDRTFTIVDLAEDLDIDDDLTALDQFRLWDQEPLYDEAPPAPAYCRVCFPVWVSGKGAPIAQDSYYYVDVATDIDGADDDTAVIIQDFAACRTNIVGTPINTLLDRANEVATQWANRFNLDQFTPLFRSYGGFQTSILPGSALDIVIWADCGSGGPAQGPVTHIGRTGRLGVAPIINGITAATSGVLTSGHPSNNFDTDILQASGGIPRGESRDYMQGPLWNMLGAASQTMGRGPSSLFVHTGPLRQWDDAVDAMAVDGQGRRLWGAKPRTQVMQEVVIPSPYYAVVLTTIQEPTTDGLTYAITIGMTTVTYTASGDTPTSVATNLAAACAASSDPGFTDYSWTSSGSVVQASATVGLARPPISAGGTGTISITPPYFTALETFVEPLTGLYYPGDNCYYYEMNGLIAQGGSYHLCYLAGSVPTAPPTPVYMDGIGNPPLSTLQTVSQEVGNASIGANLGYVDTGYQITLPIPGRYLIYGNVTGGIILGTGDYANLWMQLYDTTAAVPISGSQRVFVAAPPAANASNVPWPSAFILGGIYFGNGTVIRDYTTTVPNTYINLYMQLTSLTGGSVGTGYVGASCSHLGAIWVAP